MPFDYADFWHSAWAEANASASSPNTTLPLRSRPPRVFYYELANSPFRDDTPRHFANQSLATDPHSHLNRHVFGGKTETNSSRYVLYSSGLMYNFAVAMDWRLRQSKVYRTYDPSSADLFFVPIGVGLTKSGLQHDIASACAKLRDAMVTFHAEPHRWLPHLNVHTAHRHFVLWPKEHWSATYNNCSDWFYQPSGLFSRFIRLAYSHSQPASLRHTAYWHLPAWYFEDPNGTDYPHLFSVPFMSSLHAYPSSASALASADAETPHAAELDPWDTTRRRPTAALFVGYANHGDTAVRQRLYDQCRALKGVCKAVPPAATLHLKQTSDFCLEPAGDTPYRKSLADSMAMGCIPILFHPMTDNANQWVWDGWRQASRVLVPREPFIRGEIQLGELLRTVPAPLLALMKHVVMTYARRFQLSLDDDIEGVGDEMHSILVRAAAYADAQHPGVNAKRAHAHVREGES
jgi:hypothetical protein